MKTQRICKKCLLKDMPEMEYFQNLYDYIERIDAQLKVDPTEYERRLAFCKECDSLQNGMCRVCGCYVELRAVMKKNNCPAIHPSW